MTMDHERTGASILLETKDCSCGKWTGTIMTRCIERWQILKSCGIGYKNQAVRHDYKEKKENCCLKTFSKSMEIVGVDDIPELFDSVIIQYQLVLNYFHLEDIGRVLVRKAGNIGDVKKTTGLKEARALGESLK